MTDLKLLWARSASFALASSLLAGCGSQPVKTDTLADIDVSAKRKPVKKTESVQRSKTDIKNAYYEFLKDAAEDDEFRVLAATRIAEIELENNGADAIEEDNLSEAEYDKSVRNTIAILEKALKDFPNAQGNDHSLYQLAKAYGQVGETEKANITLRKMVALYPQTPYYTEATFRIAESAFIHQDYEAAERAYGEVLKAPSNDAFVEKSLFKRGWSRFKQELYDDALADYYRAIDAHQFGNYESLSKTEKELNDEYFRAIGLAFAYLGGATAIDQYLASNPNQKNAYRTYKVVSDLLLQQERYSDAVDTLQAYIHKYPSGSKVATAHLAKLAIWKEADFFNQFVAEFEVLFEKYHSQSPVWRRTNAISPEEKQKLNVAIRENAVLLAGFYHNRFNKKNKPEDWESAIRWYERYLAGYATTARQDKIYPRYAELLNRGKRYEQAFKYFELAAFDGDIVLDKESAYATVYLSDQLYARAAPAQKAKWLEKHLRYAMLYGQLYPKESHTPEVIEHAVQLAFKNGQLERTIEMANVLPDSASSATRRDVGLLRAQAYFDLKQYEDAEVMYQDLLVDKSLPSAQRKDLSNKLALSIYQQAEALQNINEPVGASQQYLRVFQMAPDSELAPTAVYDAIAVFMSNNMWEDAITYLKIFEQTFPGHSYQKEVGKKLSVAYLNADRGLEAAQEFEKLASYVSNEEEKMAALWQAGELYLKKSELPSALRAFKEYANNYPRPYATYMEAMQNVVDIYQKQGEKSKRQFWLNKIISADKKAVKSNKTERTQYIAANASFSMAGMRHDDFEKVRLVHPLAASLKRKKVAMQESVKWYGQATVYGHQDLVTQSTFEIGRIYRHFASALLESERPRNLNADELEQYNILLEDQAFPFEDKAIEFYETNVSRIAGGTYDEWIQNSLNELSKLFPARYGRQGKIETYVEQL